MNNLFLEYAKKIQSIAQIGLNYSFNPYDIERYQQLRELSFQMMETLSNTPVESISNLFRNELGYQTPKTDVRGIVFRNNEILMVQERTDKRWTLPGGWADIGLSPNEIAVKEIWEESGIEAEPVRLVAIHDKNKHAHPPSPWHVYKIFILCSETGGTLKPGLETLDARFFSLNNLPPLSEERITEEQIRMCFEYKNDPFKMPLCD